MIIDDQHYDVIIVGTGAGGGTLAYKLAPIGKKILILERGDYMPLQDQNVSDVEVFRKERYHAPEQWYDLSGEPFTPQTNYAIGGNTKIYASALLRMREQDFEEVKHQKGISPAWGLKYPDFEPYYTEAERLYNVHGTMGDDPTEPPHSGDFSASPPASEPQIQELVAAIAQQGLHPAPIPLGLTLESKDPSSDAQNSALEPALTHSNVTLKTSAKVVRLHTNPSGKVVKAVEALIGNESFLFSGDIVVLSCGAINSAGVLLRSRNEKHPNGLANSSDQVGRNLMKHLISSVVQVARTPNSGTFRRSVYVNDFYWGGQNFPYPMGHIQNTGGLLQDVIFTESPPILSGFAKLLPGYGLNQLATHSIGWWVQTEDLPDPNNRVHWVGEKLHVDYTANNIEAHDRLIYFWVEALKAAEKSVEHIVFQRGGGHPRSLSPLSVVANQCGTCRFGTNPATSVLDLNCRTHDLDNLYVVDSSFFPSNAGVGPALTVIANALRVGDHLIERLK